MAGGRLATRCSPTAPRVPAARHVSTVVGCHGLCHTGATRTHTPGPAPAPLTRVTQGAKVPLQRIRLTLPPGAGFNGVTFVLRSADGTRWYRDADRNFFVPIPIKGQEVEQAAPVDT